MGDRLHSDDDNVEKDTTTSDTERVHSAGGVDLPGVNRPVSEPPAPGSPKRAQSTPSPRPSAFTEWLTDWEDVRPDGSRPDPVAVANTDTVEAPDSVAEMADAPVGRPETPRMTPQPAPLRSRRGRSRRGRSRRLSRPVQRRGFAAWSTKPRPPGFRARHRFTRPPNHGRHRRGRSVPHDPVRCPRRARQRSGSPVRS